MSLRSQWRSARPAAWSGAGLAMVLGAIFLIFNAGDGLTRWSYSLPFALRSNITAEEAVIVYMDEDSHQRLQQPFFQPWNRLLHAQLIDRLRECGARTIAFDIVFDARTTNDPALVRAIKEHGRVILGARNTPVGIGEISVLNPLLPNPELMAVAAWGMAELAGDDEMVRQHYRVASHSTNIVSLAWRTAQVAGVRPLPDPLGARWLNYYGPPGIIPWVSYSSVLDGSCPPHLLSNKVAFVGTRVGTGFTGGRGTDDFITPYSRESGRSPGVEILATTCLNLLRGDSLVRLSPLKELTWIVFVGAVAGIGLSFCRPLTATILGLAGMIGCFAVGCALAWNAHVWFPWAIASVVQLPCAAICAAAFGSQRVYREKANLEAQLARIGATPPEPAGALSPVAMVPNPMVAPVPARLPTVAASPVPSGGDAAANALPTPNSNRPPGADGGIVRPDVPPIPDCVPIRQVGPGRVWRGLARPYRAGRVPRGEGRPSTQF